MPRVSIVETINPTGIAEIVCYDRALTAADTTAIKAYFSARYGI